MRGDHRTRLTQALATMLLAPLSVGACAISQQQEVALGASSAAQVSRELPLVHDALVTQYITTLGRQLAAATDTRGLTWTFTVVDTKEVNAFALPGGWIYVNRGLIERAGTMSELAGVLAHEIGHVTRRHSVRQLQQLHVPSPAQRTTANAGRRGRLLFNPSTRGTPDTRGRGQDHDLSGRQAQPADHGHAGLPGVPRAPARDAPQGIRPYFRIAANIRSTGMAWIRRSFAPVVVSAASSALVMAASVACTVA